MLLQKLTATLIGCSILLGLAACAAGDTSSAKPTVPSQESSGGASAAAGKPIRLGLVTQSQSNPFHVQLRDAAVAAAEKAGVELTVLASQSMEEQLKVMEDLAQTHPDAIAVSATDAKGIVPAIEAAREMGIYAFAVDNNITDTEVSAFIGTDNVMGGEIATQWIVDKIGENGKVGLILGTAGSFASNARQEGFYNIMKNHPGIEAQEVTANWKRDQALTVANDILTATPDINCIFALNDDMALGAVQAVESAGRRGEVLVMGFNGTPDAVLAVYNGELDATVVQFPEMMASTYIEVTVALIREGKQPEKEYLIPASVVDTKLIRDVVDNGKQPENELEELLYPKLIAFVKGE